MTAVHKTLSFNIGDSWSIAATLHDAGGATLDLAGAQITWTLTDIVGSIVTSLGVGSGITIGEAPGSCIILVPAATTSAINVGTYTDKVVVTLPDGWISTQSVGNIAVGTAEDSLLLANFRERFPEYNQISDRDIVLALQVADLFVDPNKWNPADVQDARRFFAAHFLSLKQQQLASVQIGGAGSMDLFIRSVGFGERRVMFGERTAMVKGEVKLGAGEAMLNYTVYGMMYLRLRARNIPSVVVV
jgi:hypothetical protein